MHLDADDIATRRTMSGAVAQDAEAPAKPERDWKRNILIFGLGLLSWVATYVGMLELIEANMGDLPIVHKVIIGFSVAMLMTMIIWLLDQLFKPHPFTTKVFYAFGYVFLSLISIGFGFGFYWKVLESRGESSRSAESAVGQVQNSLHAASTRLEQLNATLVQLTGVSTAKAELERTKGTSCPNSKPGDGPRRHMREEDAQRFSFASEFVNGRVGAVKGDMTALNGDLAKIVSADASTFDVKTGTRNEFMKALGRKLDLTVTGFNAFRTDPQLRQIRTDLADRAERTTFGDPKGGGAVSCPDPQLQMALRGVVKAIDQLPELEKPQIAAVEGSEATIEAFRRLTTTFSGLLAFKMPPSADELRDLQKKAVQSVESATGQGAAARNAEISSEQGGLSKRDYVPLAVALFVDLCLFLVSMVQKSAGRLDSMLPKMQAAERGPVIQILSRFNEIHRDKEIRENFEIFRHVVFDMNGDYYVAVPMDAPPKLNPKERDDLRVEAQLLSNLFASFEKEKIFKRTMLPTNASIQKRLKRQGSKFAGSEAFRVYKFTDGAWSDIILGAVMGAAKRVEASGRTVQTSRAGAPQGAPVQPTPPMPSQTMVGPAAGQPVPGPGFAPQQQPQQPQPASVMTAMRRPAFAALRKSAVSIDPEHVSRFGPYAETYQPQQQVRTPPPYALAPQGPRVAWPAPPPLPEADVTVKAATPPALPQEAGNDSPTIAPMQRMPVAREETPTEKIGVTLSRETATFSMPVSEAQLPQSLHAALAKARDYARPAAIAAETAILNVEDVDDLETSDEHATSVTETELTDHDMAFIGRMAPQAAE